eukprot:9809534-Alexandrium_andersonii.AAC.1
MSKVVRASDRQRQAKARIARTPQAESSGTILAPERPRPGLKRGGGILPRENLHKIWWWRLSLIHI